MAGIVSEGKVGGYIEANSLISPRTYKSLSQNALAFSSLLATLAIRSDLFARCYFVGTWLKTCCLPKRKAAHNARPFKKDVNEWNSELQVLDQVRENVTDGRAEQGENDDNNDGDQNQNQRVFYEALAFFTRHVQHNDNLLTHNVELSLA